MAAHGRPQDRKRTRADEPSRDDPPAKRVRSAESNKRANFSPAFWDNLSKVWLTPRALRELDRRSNTRCRRVTAPDVRSNDLARFARHGGPDLRHLRGYPEPQAGPHAMSSRALSQTAHTRSTEATTVSSRRGRSSAYDQDFEQYINDHHVYANNRRSKPKGVPDLRPPPGERMRASLSPSRFSDHAFEAFQDAHDEVGSEGDVMRKIIPAITGDAHFPNSGDVLFNNLKSITGGKTVDAKPDFCDGARREDIDQSVRNNLNGLIIPSKTRRGPVAPNLFLEAKSPWGGADIAKRQACLDGAYGARAMHALQNYGEDEAQYDGVAYTFSSTYHAGAGTLHLYAHHVTAPTTPEGRPEYHMTQVRAFAMTNDRDTFVQGATAFRNARDLAKQHRDSFIQAANVTASRAVGVAAQADASEPNEDEISTSHEPCELVEPMDPAEYAALQNADDILQQQIAEASFYDFEGNCEVPPAPHRLYAEDGSQEASEEPAAPGDDPSMSLTSSFTSGFSADQNHPSKRSRPSLSPTSKAGGSRTSKSRTRPSAARRTTECRSPTTTTSAQAGPSGSHWVEAYGRRGKVYFKNVEGLEVKTEPKDWARRMVDERECFYWEDSGSGQTFWATELPKETRKRGNRQ